MAESLKKTTGKALFWSFIDRGGQQFIQLVFGCILARLLAKDEFGLVAVLAVFTAIANILQESGFSAALIRKKNAVAADFSSVFYFNVVISLFIYLILFFSAPLIASFYDKPILTDLSRLIFLAFVFNAFGIIQNVNLIRHMDFKTNTRITLISFLASGIVAISMAFAGYGVWSLGVQLVLQSLLRTLLMWFFVRWRPTAGFSSLHLKSMASYSVKLLMSSVINQICGNLYAIIIGKHFSMGQAGVYSQANKLSVIPQSVISDGIRNVAYPVLTKIDDEERLKNAFRKIVRMTAFISFPTAMLLITLAEPIIVILLSNKWIDAVPLLQILAIGGAFYPLLNLPNSLLQKLGRTGLLFKIELSRNVLSLLLLIVSVRYGIEAMVGSISLTLVISFFVSMGFAGRWVSYSLQEVLSDIAPYFAVAIVAFLPGLFIAGYIDNIYVSGTIALLIGCLIYLFVVKVLGSVIIKDTIDFIKDTLNNKSKE